MVNALDDEANMVKADVIRNYLYVEKNVQQIVRRRRMQRHQRKQEGRKTVRRT